jgi:pyridoxamine 5'-phosphate oxidase
MIKFVNTCTKLPITLIKSKYEQALNLNQRNIQVMSISSFNKITNQVDSRYVNLKFIDNDNFIFFSNYQSPKSLAFQSHNQTSALLYWDKINLQIRIRAKIERTSEEYNNEYFRTRSKEKNALAISSKQSNKIKSYEDVLLKYNQAKLEKNLLNCPEYWGGFALEPYEIELWEGHNNRLNKRELYKKIHKNKSYSWQSCLLEP